MLCPGTGRTPERRDIAGDGRSQCAYCDGWFYANKNGLMRAHQVSPQFDPRWQESYLRRRLLHAVKKSGANHELEYYA